MSSGGQGFSNFPSQGGMKYPQQNIPQGGGLVQAQYPPIQQQAQPQHSNQYPSGQPYQQISLNAPGGGPISQRGGAPTGGYGYSNNQTNVPSSNKNSSVMMNINTPPNSNNNINNPINPSVPINVNPYGTQSHQPSQPMRHNNNYYGNNMGNDSGRRYYNSQGGGYRNSNPVNSHGFSNFDDNRGGNNHVLDLINEIMNEKPKEVENYPPSLIRMDLDDVYAGGQDAEGNIRGK